MFRKTINELFEKCPCSCEHNLTNRALNRIAWIGQAAVVFKYHIPAIFCSGFQLLNEHEQDAANSVAFEELNKWLLSKGLETVSFDEAYQSGRQVELY